MGIASFSYSLFYILGTGTVLLLLRLFPENLSLPFIVLLGNTLFFGLFIGLGLGIAGLFQRQGRVVFSAAGLALNLLIISAILLLNYRYG